MEKKKIIHAADYLPKPKNDSNNIENFELSTSEQLLWNLFGDSPDYTNQKFEDIWQEVLDTKNADTIAYCLTRDVDVIGNDGTPVIGWRDIAVMLKAIERGIIKTVDSEEDPMKTIDDVLNHLIETEADPMIVRPATDKDIKQCNKDFAKCELDVSLPSQYADFLKQLDGFAWNGIEFFSTYQVTDTETDYMLNDIVSANEDFCAYNGGLEHCVLLGRADDDLYVYNTSNGRYEVLDMSGMDVMEDYETFEAMFIGVVAPRI